MFKKRIFNEQRRPFKFTSQKSSYQLIFFFLTTQKGCMNLPSWKIMTILMVLESIVLLTHYLLFLASLNMSQVEFGLRVWQLLWYIWISIAGCVGNSIVIYITFKSSDIQRKTPFNVYLLTLAIVDLIISIFAIPTIYQVYTNYNIYQL